MIRPAVSVWAIVAVVAASCGGERSSTPVTAGATAPAAVDTQSLSDALADVSWTPLARAGQDLDGAVEAAVGRTSVLEGGTLDWLTERRSEVVSAALDAAGVDHSGIGATAFSRQPIAEGGAGVGMTWLGSSMAVPLTMSVLTGRIGETSTASGQPQTSHDETTIGGQHTVADTTTVISSSLSGSQVIVDAEVSQTSTTTDAAGATVSAGTYRSHLRAELDACPDANGTVVLRMEMDLSSTSSTGGASFTLHATSVQEGQVGEDAYLQSTQQETDTTQEVTDAGGTTTTGSSHQSVSTAQHPNGGGFARVTGATSSTGPGTMDAAESARWGNFVQLTVGIASARGFTDAQAAWRGGKCVRIEATEQSRDVEALDTIPFTAKAVHAIEGVDLAKPVVAVLVGAQSILPEGTPQQSPASLTYIAGPDIGASGAVTLTSTSNRGIGTLAITFTVEASVVLELEIDSHVTPLVLNGLTVVDGSATATGRIRLAETGPDQWSGNGSLASVTTSADGGCQTITVAGRGSYDWQVREVIAGPDVAAADIVADIDAGLASEQPDTFTARTCPVALTGTMNTWENLFFVVHNGKKDVNGLRVTGWTLNATPDTWIDGGLVATATWSGSCPPMVIPGGPGEDDDPLAIPGFLECEDRTTFRIWAVPAP